MQLTEMEVNSEEVEYHLKLHREDQICNGPLLEENQHMREAVRITFLFGWTFKDVLSKLQ